MKFQLNLFIVYIFRRLKCNNGSGFPPLYVNVHMKTGDTVNYWIDSLQAAWSSVQVSYSNNWERFLNSMVCCSGKLQ